MRNSLPQRKNIRLKEYDYSREGMYFITICVKNRAELLGKIIIAEGVGANCVRPQMQLSPVGIIINAEINKIENIYENVFIDEYVIMPNHIHMILEIKKRTNTVRPYNFTNYQAI